MLGFHNESHGYRVRDIQNHCQRTYYTDSLELTFQSPSVQKATVCETEYDRRQNKKYCKLAIGVKGKGVKQMRMKKIILVFPSSREICLHKWL